MSANRSIRFPRRTAFVLAGVLGAAAALAALTAAGCARGSRAAEGKRVIVLGFDGMDYSLTRELMAEGRMPNFSRLAEAVGLQPLGTSVPPQSPVAWSEFITGLDAGGHGIFDFLHRDPKTLIPYLSTSRAVDPETIKLGPIEIPWKSGRVELLRRGQAFWDVLEEHGVETTIIRIPANFPPSGTATRELSGMGTPDILGTTGTFSFYTSELFAFDGEDVSGGRIYAVDLWDDVVEAELHGPEGAKTPFKVYLDLEAGAAKLAVGEEERVLKKGEWSDWVIVDFELGMTTHVSAITRFYLKSLEPEFELYAAPLNIDPRAPAMPISTPEDYAADLAEATGYYYTQGMPEDTKTLSEGVFDVSEFLAQARIAGDEFIRQYHHVLGRFERGLLFYYFGNLDQTSHMLWRAMDPEHPAYDAEKDAPYADVIKQIYVELDGVVGYTMERLREDDTLVVMSDHGFTSWRRSFHLNTWLRDAGYIVMKDPGRRDDPGLFGNVDWSRSRAYGLGLNGLYLNLRGRERNGIVPPEQREALMEEIAAKLLAVIDPATGQPAVTKVYRREEIYQDRGELEIGPDLQIGYAKGTRGTGESALGEFPPVFLEDNTDEWSGDHCMDHEAVPGILLTNRPLRRPAARLKELGASILAEFGIEGFPEGGGAGTGALP